MKTTQENNRLIAEFMGYETHPNQDLAFKVKTTGNEKGTINLNIAKYNSSWNWLMPVVEKIDSMQPEGYNTLIEGSSCWVETPDVSFEGIGKNKLEATYRACVQFIEWWNEQSAAEKNS